MTITLREIRDADLPALVAQMSDAESIRMAAFAAEDATEIRNHWTRVRADPTVNGFAIVDDADVVLGHIAVYGPPEEREVTYWVGRDHWGRGVATAALRALLSTTGERPLQARAVADNLGSLRVLEKCGFVRTGADRDFCPVRGEDVEEVLLTVSARGS